MRLFEDLYELQRSQKFVERVDQKLSVLNTRNTRHGVSARRGDGTFGEIVPGAVSLEVPGFHVARGPIATIEIGVEVKIIAKAMIKQIDRVISDLGKQVQHFSSRGARPITVGIVGVNWADEYCSFEGDRAWPTDGRKYKHPIQEADEAQSRLLRYANPLFDELVILPFVATNMHAYNFAWKDAPSAEMDYAAALARISSTY